VDHHEVERREEERRDMDTDEEEEGTVVASTPAICGSTPAMSTGRSRERWIACGSMGSGA